MLVKMLGLFGLVLGLAYLNEAVSFSTVALHAYWQRAWPRFLTFSAFIFLDFFFGAVLAVSALGLVFAKDWARKTWLILTPALVLTHLTITLVGEIHGTGVTAFYLVWTGMVILVTVVSWWYLTEPKIRAEFAGRPQEPLAPPEPPEPSQP